jgi:hypothetical protein
LIVTQSVFRTVALRIVIAVILAVSVSIIGIGPRTSFAQDNGVLSGIIVGVETDENGNLTRFALSDSTGNVTTY